jgi:Carboxypeptidase regulatory-like domain
MSTTQNNRHASAHWLLRTLWNRTLMLLLIGLAGGLTLVVPVSAQSIEGPNTRTGSILGTVVDSDNETIPNATVVLQETVGDPLVVTKDDGSFAFHDVTPGIAHQVTVAAEGFAEWSASVTVEPGQKKTLTDVTLHILAVRRAVTVTYSSEEVAAQQLKAEEQQRVFGFIPNIYVVYEPHPEPLTARMKFHLAYKGLTHPTFFAVEAAWAGVQQAANTPDYRQGAKGYGERFGANLAGGVSEGLFANAILPSLLHQDPRYFYQGSGTKGSRAWHAVIAPFVCEGDNGKLQPNYSQWGGSLISASFSNAYYPQSNRGAGLVFENFGTSMGLHVVLGLAQEFVLDKFTSKHKRQ